MIQKQSEVNFYGIAPISVVLFLSNSNLNFLFLSFKIKSKMLTLYFKKFRKYLLLIWFYLKGHMGFTNSTHIVSLKNKLNNAPVAQLDRVPDFESVGRRFESCRACFFISHCVYW